MTTPQGEAKVIKNNVLTRTVTVETADGKEVTFPVSDVKPVKSGETSVKKHYYITTPIYYINDVPHIGHAYTTCAADVMARYKRICGYEVFFLTGVDEHGQKAQKSAARAGHSRRRSWRTGWCPPSSISGSSSTSRTRGSYRTTDAAHRKVVQYLFEKIYEKGDIYLGEYEDWYCIPCESYFTELQLEGGQMPRLRPARGAAEGGELLLQDVAVRRAPAPLSGGAQGLRHAGGAV